MNPSTNGATLQDPSRVRALTKEPTTKESTTKPPGKRQKVVGSVVGITSCDPGCGCRGMLLALLQPIRKNPDDAYVTGHEHPVSFRVAGTISEVLVDDNQLVKTGTTHCRS
jgi:membrane fusion protein (multidrug efflux system)